MAADWPKIDERVKEMPAIPMRYDSVRRSNASHRAERLWKEFCQV